jgi:hypothetical protein
MRLGLLLARPPLPDTTLAHVSTLCIPLGPPPGQSLVTHTTIFLSATTCTQKIITDTHDAYVAFLKAQPNIVPESVQVTVTCNDLVGQPAAVRTHARAGRGCVKRPCAGWPRACECASFQVLPATGWPSRCCHGPRCCSLAICGQRTSPPLPLPRRRAAANAACCRTPASLWTWTASSRAQRTPARRRSASSLTAAPRRMAAPRPAPAWLRASRAQ